MKDKIISFILITLIIGVLGVIGTLGYAIYKEIMAEGSITGDFTIDEDMFDTSTERKQSRYLYNQLGNTAKQIYNKLYQNKENLKTGTFRIDFGNEFKSLLSQENGDKELNSQYQSAIEALLYENPDIFYLDVTKMYMNIEKITKITGTKYNVYIDNGNETTYLSNGFYCKEDVEKYEDQIEQVKNQIISQISGKSEYEKIKVIHDYLIDTIEYEETLTQNHIYDIYGALINKICVCEGYAKAFQYLMNQTGIENTIVIGTGENSKNQTENHAWNYVRLNEQWYAIDVTWDDPVITGVGKLTNKSRYKYFLKGSKTMGENHFPSGRFTADGQIFEYPTLSVEDYK